MNIFQKSSYKNSEKLFMYKYIISYKSLSIEKGVANKIAIGKNLCFNL